MNNVIVSLDNVVKHYKQLTAISGITLDICQGEVLGLFGHNGAGKTTMMKLILGVISPSSGGVSLFQQKADSQQAFKIRSQIGYLPENVSFYEQLTGLEVLTYFCKLKGHQRSEAVHLLEQVGIHNAMNRAVKTYSKGMRQRLGLAQAFIGKPKLLILDEPTVGLDPIATADFYHTVSQLKQRGCSVILCSHVLPGVEHHIDRVMILSKGKQLALGDLGQLRRHANLPAKITPIGLNGNIANNSQLLKYLTMKADFPNTLYVPEDEKLMVIKELLNCKHLQDIHIESADLQQIYQFYLQQTDQLSGAQQ